MSNDDDDSPLINESTVELMERTRREARLPAKPEAEAIGAANEMIAALRVARGFWNLAVDAARTAELRDRLLAEADVMARRVAALSTVVRDLGGVPPHDAALTVPLPFAPRDLDYASDDAAIAAGIASNHAHLEALADALAERAASTDSARRAILG